MCFTVFSPETGNITIACMGRVRVTLKTLQIKNLKGKQNDEDDLLLTPMKWHSIRAQKKKKKKRNGKKFVGLFLYYFIRS